MKIAIIGAGFTGLTAAYELLKRGHEVTVFEKESLPGGLALGFKKANWTWTLEEYYHHWFTNDSAVLNLAKEINVDVITVRPKTSSYIQKKHYQLDSPITFLKFTELNFLERLRMVSVLGFLRLNPFWKPLESVTAAKFLPNAMGQKAYALLWEPLLKNKFGNYADTISLAWFWARIRKRTSSLAYPEGGFLMFAKKLAEKIEGMNGKIIYNASVISIQTNGNTDIYFKTLNSGEKMQKFDKTIVTLPSFLFTKICPQLPDQYKQRLTNLKGLGAVTLILRLKKPFLTDGTYWLNICNSNSPILAVVEHTNFMDKKYYDNECLVYLGNYLPKEHKFFKMDGREMLKEFDPLLSEIHPGYKKLLIGFDVFKVPFAQPIIPINYSVMIPSHVTPLPNVYLANMQQVYPWDRGTNYAVELGQKITDIIS